ncbi:uncharacterized protein MCYG_00641 [Microsporum canis CBS 113480]|uniref:Uncharacterized protein n=1 Tax=Arthroderma otae (strain ATCC MYA-4605 / CBS 113480) TaxID=554155 RepID=C5FD69_ARTOC|nr:uncharacterized protein MCYG_00641 [Microsporum canis CBS 113480]EEQ27753.1 predicted protein [Microsporum canis CBS 113480]
MEDESRVKRREASMVASESFFLVRNKNEAKSQSRNLWMFRNFPFLQVFFSAEGHMQWSKMIGWSKPISCLKWKGAVVSKHDVSVVVLGKTAHGKKQRSRDEAERKREMMRRRRRGGGGETVLPSYLCWSLSMMQ